MSVKNTLTDLLLLTSTTEPTKITLSVNKANKTITFEADGNGVSLQSLETINLNIGKTVELISKSKNSKELYLYVTPKLYLPQLREPEYFINKTGIKVVITKPNLKLTDKNIKSLYDAISIVSLLLDIVET